MLGLSGDDFGDRLALAGDRLALAAVKVATSAAAKAIAGRDLPGPQKGVQHVPG